MKNLKIITFLALLTCASATIARAQKISASRVPAAVKSSFTKIYPGINKVAWEMEKDKFEANFRKDGQEMSSLFTSNGTITESEKEIKPDELPANILPYVSKHYKGFIVKEASKIIKTDGTVNYEAEVHGKDLVFDVKGNFIKVDED